MARKNISRGAQGSGTIRKKTVVRKGHTYTFWEARLTVGYDPGTGKQIQRSFSGKTQKDVREKMQAAAVEVNAGTYKEPSKMTLGEWLDTWLSEYLGGVKPMTVVNYTQHVENHIKPALGKTKLCQLDAPKIQHFYNDLQKPHGDTPGLAAKTVKCVNGVLHKALQQAVAVGYLRFNPADACKLPKVVRKEIKPLDNADISAFLKAIEGHCFEAIYILTLFTGLRRGEVCGLTWDCIDFEKGTMTINKQLQNIPGQPGAYRLISAKNGKSRTIALPSTVITILKQHKIQQTLARLQAGELWENSDFVFTNEVGHHVSPNSVYNQYKRIVASIGLPQARFHDLRHSYAVAAIQSGDDIKTVQGNLGHATASFTLDVYGHVTDQMKQNSAARMEKFIEKVSGE